MSEINLLKEEAEEHYDPRTIILTELCGNQKRAKVNPLILGLLSSNFDKFKVETSDLQTRIKTLRPMPVSELDNSLVQILRLKATYFKAELDLEEGNSVGLNIRPTFESMKALLVIELDLHNDLISDKKQKLSYLNDRIEYFNHHISEEETLIKSAHQDKETEPPFQTELSKLIKREEYLRSQSEKSLKDLTHILEKFYSPPNQDEIRKVAAKNNYQIDIATVIPLKGILRSLLTKILTEPEDPWIKLHSQFWPPDIDLIFSAGIIKIDPEDANRICLIDFGK